MESAQTLEQFSNSSVGQRSPRLQLAARTWLATVTPTVRLQEGIASARAGSLRIYGFVGQAYEVQASSDLAQWETLDRRLAAEVPYDVTDPTAAAGAPRRFYRVVWWP